MMPDPTTKQRFNAMVSVQFYQVSQTTELWVPQPPQIFEPLKRNTLYPFYIYGSSDDSA